MITPLRRQRDEADNETDQMKRPRPAPVRRSLLTSLLEVERDDKVSDTQGLQTAYPPLRKLE